MESSWFELAPKTLAHHAGVETFLRGWFSFEFVIPEFDES
jgi:hypothetical protein